MAGARAATSLSFTIGIAFATLMVAGGILAGPAILDCSHQPQGFGSCLRGKVVQDGLLPAELPPPSRASAEELQPHAPGWIEADATEYQVGTAGVARLSPEPGRLGAFGALRSAEVSAQTALADRGTAIRAGGLAPLSGPSAAVELTPAITGSIDASAAAGRTSGLSGDVSIAPPALPAPPDASGRIGLATHGQGRASLAPQLIADLSPAPPLTEIVPAPVPKALPPVKPRSLTVPEAAAQIKSEPQVAPSRPPKYDPRYPNVLVLPPPNTGENSSFATLELR